MSEKQLACYDSNKESVLKFVTRKGTAVMIMKKKTERTEEMEFCKKEPRDKEEAF